MSAAGATGREQVLEGNRRVHAVEASRYDQLHSEIFNWWQQQLLEKDLACALALLPPGRRRILDLGCGTGNLALRLHAGGHQVDAVDLSPDMLACLRAKRAEDDRLRLHCVDADTFLRTAHSYDFIAFSSVLHHLPDYVATLMHAAAALADNGALFITHEPLPRGDRRQASRLHRAVSHAGAMLDESRRRACGVRVPAIDYSESDIHVEEGIVPENLVSLLEREGLRLISVRRYRPERFGLSAFLNNVLLGAPPTQFALLLHRASERDPGARDPGAD